MATNVTNSLRLAVQFLTRLPVAGCPVADGRALGYSLLWYPAVGLLIAAIVTVTAVLSLAVLPTMIAATLTLIVWVAVTGALHLDGLGDCADAWVGAHGRAEPREATLKILKDPRCGVMAVVAITLALLLKFSLIITMIGHDLLAHLWLAPVLSRTMVLSLFLVTRYVNAHGLGAELADHLPRHHATKVFAASWLATLIFVPVALWLLLAVTSALILFGLRHLTLARLGGFTGDGAGALIEIQELAIMLSIVAYWL